MLQVAVAYDNKTLGKLKDEMEPRVAEALRQNAEDILWMARALCPVLTGALRASLHIEQTGEFEYAVRDGVPYGIMVEKGHRTRSGSFVEPQPFLGPAVDRMRQRCEKRIGDAIMTAVERKAAEAEEQIERNRQRLREMMEARGAGFATKSEVRVRMAPLRRK